MSTAPNTAVFGHVKDAIQAAEALMEGAGRSRTLPAASLGELLEVMKILVSITVSSVRPAASQTLPSVVLTLSSLVKATETAAQKVLDETDGLHVAQEKLNRALAELEGVSTATGPVAERAWREATESCQAVSAHVNTIVSAMGFQDLTAQHLTATIHAAQEMRDQLSRVLRFIGVAPKAEAPPTVRTAAKLGAPTVVAPWRQDLADQLMQEFQARPDGSASP